ncbi:maleylpyruvate isomerase family mycothiol-dependent enzyme [soil metagenome]
MRVADHIAAVDEHGQALHAAAQAAGLTADVPNCPTWTVDTLLAHVGKVHRWAATFLREGKAATAGGKHPRAAVAPAGGVLEWYADGHAALLAAMRAAPADLDCWTFVPGLAPLPFWARRQAHETAIHRADADSALDRVPTYDPALAADGIDELLAGFFTRGGGKLVSDPPVSLAVRPTDVDRSWRMQIGPTARRTTSPSDEPADCTLTGPASELYLLLWNRRRRTEPDIIGDPAVLELWRSHAQVRSR